MKDMTVKELFDKVWRDHWDKPRFHASGWATEVDRLWKRMIEPKFGDKPYSGVTGPKLRAWHEGMAETPVTANRALEVVSKLYSYAEDRGWRPWGTNPVKQVRAHKERKRKRFARPEEIRKLATILEREAPKNPKAVAFIYILLFSGARPRSIERSTWNMLQVVEHENQTFGVLTFHGKSSEATGEDEQVIIPPQALILLKKPAKETETLLGIKMPKDFWRRVRKEAGCDDLWARDLRRTFATIGLSNGVGLGVIGELLNHKSISTTKRYATLTNDKRLSATKEIADQISLLLKGGAK